MKKQNNSQNLWLLIVMFFSFLTIQNLQAQENLFIHTESIDGIDITPDNILGYQIQSQLTNSINANLVGNIRFRNSEHWINYTTIVNLKPGTNLIEKNAIVTWKFSSNAMKELFTQHHQLPVGMYEYCISLTPQNVQGELEVGKQTQECIYNKSQELFIINLISPENEAKLYEFNPMFNWTANCSFITELSYKIKVAEIKRGQNTANAIQRNNPIYQESGLLINNVTYPLTAKPLITYQPYAWTVDAYYKGILIGSAEPWKFIILEDTLPANIPKSVSYVDITHEQGVNKYYALGDLKLRYILTKLGSEKLELKLFKGDEEVSIKTKEIILNKGDNKFQLDFTHQNPLKHNKTYMLEIKNSSGKIFKITFLYVNPEYL